MKFKIGAFIDRGLDHINREEACQDAVIASQELDRFLIAASDGAGSAKRSDEGSKLLLECVDQKFKELSCNVPLVIGNVLDVLVNAIHDFRARCKSLEGAVCLREFACTLVGAVGDTAGACIVFHIGDGAVLFSSSDDVALVSGPENGEYSNETFFVTMENWQDHLRAESFSFSSGALMVMTDGVTPFALSPKGPFPQFLQPLYKFLRDTDDREVNKILTNTLSSSKAQSICRDDKALAWVIKG